MPKGPHFRPSLCRARQRLDDEREQLKAHHRRGSSGISVCARLTALLDDVLIGLYQAALEDLGLDAPNGIRQQIALVPLGGYGRRALAPWSDIDLMLLHTPAVRRDVALLAKRLMQDIFDVGLDLGHSVRTPAEACQLARGDSITFTSLIESRLLAGSDTLHGEFLDRFAKLTQRRSTSLVDAIVACRREEQNRYGKTIYLLEPNIKRTRGGLRDLHLLRWVGFTKFGVADPDELQRIGAISKQDQRRLREAHEFLARIRNEMHFHAGKANDTLDRAEQVRIAALLGFLQTRALLPVERFMREYFRHTSNVRYIVTRFVENVRPAPAVTRIFASMFSHWLGKDYRVGPRHISATAQGLARLKIDLGEVLRLVDLASQFDKRIDHATWAAVYRTAPRYGKNVSDRVAKRFLALLGRPVRLGELLRSLHELGVLEKIIPAFSHARGLLQFNEYHKFTVDEHCIRAVECATRFAADQTRLGDVYRQIEDKATLHLAILLHDLGKGFERDHSQIGRQIARETAARLGLPESASERLQLLVAKHLRMSHLAFRRDTSDEALIVRFAVEVGSPGALRMLYVLACADLDAVGPGVFNDWKSGVLGNLYRRTMRHLTGSAVGDTDEELQQRRRKVLACMGDEDPDDWVRRQIDTLPPGCLWEVPPETIAGALPRLRKLGSDGADVWASYLPETETVEFLIGVHQALDRGLFYRLTGALTAQGLTVLSADINTLADGLILDRFIVWDQDYEGEPPAHRLKDVCQAVLQAIHRPEPPKFRQLWGTDRRSVRTAEADPPAQVHTDNSISAQATVVDVFALDRKGLLYTIARTLFELNLSIRAARIGTYLDQVVDVFYVTELNGVKVQDDDRLQEIRQRLLRAVEEPDGP